MTVVLAAEVADRYILFVGLTDLNLDRMTNPEGEITVPLKDIPKRPTEIIIFHATRTELLRLADALGIDQTEFLDRVGEG